VKLLLDTHILLWSAGQPDKLSESARTLLTTPENDLFFSAASIWEIVIKLGLGREDFKVDPYRLRKMLVVHGYTEPVDINIRMSNRIKSFIVCIKLTITKNGIAKIPKKFE